MTLPSGAIVPCDASQGEAMSTMDIKNKEKVLVRPITIVIC